MSVKNERADSSESEEQNRLRSYQLKYHNANPSDRYAVGSFPKLTTRQFCFAAVSHIANHSSFTLKWLMSKIAS